MSKIILFIFLGITANLYSQNEIENRATNSQKNVSIIKISTIKPLIGEFPLGWELQIGEKLSLEIEGGITFSEIDYLKWESNEHEGGERTGFPISSMKTSTISELGATVEIGLRVYASNRRGALNGFYIAPKLKYKRYNYTLMVIDSYGNVIPLDLKKSWEDRYSVGLEIGYQLLLKRFCVDGFIGMRTSFSSDNKLYAMQHWYDSSWHFYWEEQSRETNIYTSGYLGLRIGFAVKK